MEGKKAVRGKGKRRDDKSVCDDDREIDQMQELMPDPEQDAVQAGRDNGNADESPERSDGPLLFLKRKMTVRLVIQPGDEDVDDGVLDRPGPIRPQDT